MQCVAFYTIVLAADSGIGIVRRSNTDFMPACETQTKTEAIFELNS